MVQVTSLRKRYGKAVALDGVTLAVAPGEIVVVMGPSGCGKSTAIRCINRLTEPDSGQISVFGEDVLALSGSSLCQLRRRIGFVFQDSNLIGRLTALENVAFPVVMSGSCPEEALAQAAEALDRVGLSSRVHHRPGDLSGGQRQRVGIARALVTNPELMLWDEPTASLDPILVGEVLDVMEDLMRTSQAAMIVVTHEVAFARKVAQKIVLMDKGCIVESGAPEAILQRPMSEIGKKYQRLMAG